MNYKDSLEYAQQLDAQDPLGNFRERFHIPQHNGKDALYFCGNSLGLQPKTATAALMQELEDWKNLGVEGHFDGKNPWFHYHKFLAEKAAEVNIPHSTFRS